MYKNKIIYANPKLLLCYILHFHFQGANIVNGKFYRKKENFKMKLNEQKKAEWEEALKKLNLIGADDVIEEHVQGDFWSFSGRTVGNYFFTRDKFVFHGGILGVDDFSIRYSDIKELKLINIRFIMPTGILVIAQNPENGKLKKYKLSVMKRKDWLAYLQSRTGLQ